MMIGVVIFINMIFIGLEQRNFSLLTYVNQLNREIEAIEIRNRELQNQLENYQDLTGLFDPFKGL